MTISDMMLLLRFTIGYPSMAVAGLILGIVALGRLRTMTDNRRRLYRPLASVAFGLGWTGVWGVLGVWQYGRFTVALPFPMAVVQTAFSIGILWIALSLVTLASVVLMEEFQHMSASEGNHSDSSMVTNK